MKIYSRKNSEDLFDIFDIEINLPTIKKIVDANEWLTNPKDPIKGFDIKFNTQIIHRRDKTFWCLSLILFGFGFTITRQTGY